MADLSFTVYFDFKTTTGDSILHDPKMFVISYCQIYAFHPELKLDKIVIFRSFEQNAGKSIALTISHKNILNILMQLYLTN